MAINAQDVSFTPTTWADGSEGGTPITAEQLNRIEEGVGNLATQHNALVSDANGLQTAVGNALSCHSTANATDMNSLGDGLFFITNMTKNRPFDWGIAIQLTAEVWSPDNTDTVQICFSTVSGVNSVYRTAVNGSFGNWINL